MPLPILGIHHVHGGPYQAWWDTGFLVLGALFLIGGYLLQRSGAPLPETGRDAGAPEGRA